MRHAKAISTLEQSVYNICKSVVCENKLQFASDILDRYKQMYEIKGGCTEDVDSYSIQHLTSKLRLALDKEVLIKADRKKSTKINQATQIAKQNHDEDKTTIWKCATISRNEIP